MMCGYALLIAAAFFLPAYSIKAQTVVFNFDTGTPAPAAGQNIPFDQTAGGITAHFSSPSGAAFSVQSDATTGWKMSQFSGNYLYDNTLNRNVLEIKFSRQLTGITLTFATADFQQVEIPTTIQLTAYLGSNGTPPLGSATAHGTYASDTMPMGTLSFSSGGRPFDLVEIVTPPQTLGATDFFVDNITVTPAAILHVLSTVSAASYLSGGPLAPGSIASGFGQGLASATEGALSQPLPTILANTTVTMKDSAGVERQAPLFYVAPTQINYLVPDDTAAGPATVTVSSSGQVTATGTVTVDSIAPGLFTANMDGQGAPAAEAITVAPDLTQTVQAVAHCGTAQGSCMTSPIDLGPGGTSVVLTLYGTGIRARSSVAAVTAVIGGVSAEVQYAGAQSQFAGLDQVNVAIPRGLTGRGEVDLILTADGRAVNTVRVNIK
jgi:uncharacterized protein (TIGR03437 family)